MKKRSLVMVAAFIMLVTGCANDEKASGTEISKTSELEQTKDQQDFDIQSAQERRKADWGNIIEKEKFVELTQPLSSEESPNYLTKNHLASIEYLSGDSLNFGYSGSFIKIDFDPHPDTPDDMRIGENFQDEYGHKGTNSKILLAYKSHTKRSITGTVVEMYSTYEEEYSEETRLGKDITLNYSDDNKTIRIKPNFKDKQLNNLKLTRTEMFPQDFEESYKVEESK